MTAKLEPAARKKQILDEAIKQASRVGYQNIKRADIAEALGVSPALVSLYFSTMPQLKRQVMRAAIAGAKTKSACGFELCVIAQGLAARDRLTLNIPPILRSAALSTLDS
jgi:AcrR family transcriptional regulator